MKDIKEIVDRMAINLGFDFTDLHDRIVACVEILEPPVLLVGKNGIKAEVSKMYTYVQAFAKLLLPTHMNGKSLAGCEYTYNQFVEDFVFGCMTEYYKDTYAMDDEWEKTIEDNYMTIVKNKRR